MSHAASTAARPSEKDADPRNRAWDEIPPEVRVDPDDDKEDPPPDGAQQEPVPDPGGKDPGDHP